jgi:hypothetical protein
LVDLLPDPADARVKHALLTEGQGQVGQGGAVRADPRAVPKLLSAFDKSSGKRSSPTDYKTFEQQLREDLLVDQMSAFGGGLNSPAQQDR